MKLPPLLGLVPLLLAVPASAAKPKNAILLSQVSSLTLRSNAQTTHRRVASIPQLKCISHPSICALHAVDLMRCTNQGSSYASEDVEWSCTASLPDDLKLGATDVICEGYASPDDEYVLKGSCGVEYRLVLTEKGERRHPELVRPGGLFSNMAGGTDWWGVIFMILFVAGLGFFIWSACFADGLPPNQRPRRNWGQGWGGGGGGGGPGGWGPGWGPGNNDPPPPYPGKPDQQQQGWQPGFWSGLGAGAAAGYWAGNRGNRREEYEDRRRFGRDAGWGGGWGGGSNDAGPSSGSSASSGTRHQSTGFGSTRRR